MDSRPTQQSIFGGVTRKDRVQVESRPTFKDLEWHFNQFDRH
jgi:hypothetical protein